MVGGPSIAFTHKVVVDEARKSKNVCKSIEEGDASQLYPYSVCQPIPTGFFIRYEFDGDLQTFKPHQNKSRSFENTVMSYFQRMRPDCRIESFYTTRTQEKVDCFNAEGFCGNCNTVFEAMGRFYHYCSCQEARLALTEEDIQRGTKMKETDEMRRQYIDDKGYTVVKMWECEWCTQRD